MSNQTIEKKESEKSSPKVTRRGRSQKPKSEEPLKEISLPKAELKPPKEEHFTIRAPSLIEHLKSMCFKCSYAKLHSPTPTAKDTEPVSEFQIKPEGPVSSMRKKYIVDEMWVNGTDFFWSIGEEKDNHMPASSVHFTRR